MNGGTTIEASGFGCMTPDGTMPILRRRFASMMRNVSAYLENWIERANRQKKDACHWTRTTDLSAATSDNN